MHYLLRTRKRVHLPVLLAAGMILLLGALVGIFVASCRVEVSWMLASVSGVLLRWCKWLLYIPPGKGVLKVLGPLGLPKRHFGKVCRDNDLTNGRAMELAKPGYSGQRQHLTRWPIFNWVVLLVAFTIILSSLCNQTHILEIDTCSGMWSSCTEQRG